MHWERTHAPDLDSAFSSNTTHRDSACGNYIDRDSVCSDDID